MRSLSLKSLLAASISFLPLASAQRLLQSQSLDPCQANSSITASLFDVIFTPDNGTIQYDINANASITGNVTLVLEVIAYGFKAATINIDPCAGSLSQNFCPIAASGPIQLQSTSPVPADVSSRVPGNRV
jgi:hypothetical protein